MFNSNTVGGFPSGYKDRGRFLQSCGVRWERRGCQHLGASGWRWDICGAHFLPFPKEERQFFSHLISLCVVSIQLLTSNLAFIIYWVPTAIRRLSEKLHCSFYWQSLTSFSSSWANSVVSYPQLEALQSNLCELCRWHTLLFYNSCVDFAWG